ncbi:tryptophan--tRNA ligase, mitochondrial-like isoform X2 [Gigantopelta aegis]|uniref:tryptophan--tRNA ligase, mitochondrial-like isoform X2 n=1 Tax=Gigantopelta aegis TaxID=1735272 RepID=UPI001B88B9B7|nr:tryptophan--tRNA ligase, mitochondrial-like isoform X2 [Gigantopelta aegis]
MALSICKRVCQFCKKPRLVFASRGLFTDNNVKFASCPPRILSGIQPTGIPHIGNYVGAIKNWVSLQQKYDDVMYSIVDLHSVTVPQDPVTLRQNIYDMTACILACGIDPEKSILFQQSRVSEHAELAWLLSCLCTLPRLEHLPQWKEKSAKVKEPGVGLFTYPILQTADIILYKSTDVPVGEDQIHHIELARHLARTFNRNFGVIFPKPNALIGEIPKIRSLRNPQSKMSKSEINPLSRIELTDTADEIQEKMKKAVSDFTPTISYDPENRPAISNLIDIHSAFTDLFPDEICENAMLMNTIEYKQRVADVVITSLKPIREEIIRLQQDKPYLDSVLQKGSERAQNIARQTMAEVKSLMGLI